MLKLYLNTRGMALSVAACLSSMQAISQDADTQEVNNFINAELQKFLDGTAIGSTGSPDDFKIDTSLPADGALALLDSSNSALVNIGTPEDFGANLINLFDSNGNLKQGLAIGGNPYWWFGRRNDSFEEYARDGDRWLRILKRTHVTFATVELTDAETTEQGSGVRASFGLSTELLDKADPRYDLASSDCLRAAIRETYFPDGELIDDVRRVGIAIARTKKTLDQDGAYPPLAGIALEQDGSVKDDDVAKFLGIINSDSAARALYGTIFAATPESKVDTAIYQSALKSCADSAKVRLQAKQSLRVAFAVAGRSDSGDIGALKQDGIAAWLSYRHPFGNGDAADGALSSWGAFAKVETDATEAVEMSEMMDMGETAMMSEEEEEMVLAKYDGWRAGLNLNRVRDDFVISGALSYVEKDFQSDMMEDEDYLLATMTASYKVRDGLWFEASFGWADDAQFDAQEFAGIRLKADWSKLGVN